MQRILNLIPIRYDSYRDMSETREFMTDLYMVKNMVELHKSGSRISIPNYDIDVDAMIKLHVKDESESTSLKLIKRFDEANFTEEYYNIAKERIHNELAKLFNEIFYKDLGYPNFAFVCAKADGKYQIALGEYAKGFKFVRVDKQTLDLMVYIGAVFGRAETLAIRNELIK